MARPPTPLIRGFSEAPDSPTRLLRRSASYAGPEGGMRRFKCGGGLMRHFTSSHRDPVRHCCVLRTAARAGVSALALVLFDGTASADSLLIGAGALSGRPWGRKAQMVVGLLALVFCLAAAAFGAPIYLPVAALGLALFLVQRRRAGAYQRAADPLVLDDT